MRISDWSSDVCSSDLDAVLLGDRRDRQDDARQVDALVVAQGAAGDHTGLRMAGGAVLDFQAQLAVVDQQGGSGREGGEDLRMRQRRALVVARRLIEIEAKALARSEEHTSELQSLMRISYAVFCLKKKNNYTKS